MSTTGTIAQSQLEDDITKIGSLGDELQALSDKFLNAAPENVQEILMDHLKQWKSTEILQEALKEGDVAPDFLLPDENGNMVSSVDLRAKGPIVVVFFRGNWCGFCNATLRMIRKYTPHFKARGASVVAISPQTMEQSRVAKKNAGLTFPVLSDVGSEYAQLLNIAYVLDDQLKTIVESSSGKTFVEINGENEYGAAVLPIPATYVIETDGRVTYSFLDTDYTKRAEPVDVLNALPPLSKRRLSLSSRIDMEISRLRESYPEHRMRDLFDAVERLKAQGVEKKALQVGQKAPDFSFRGKDGEWIDSKKLRRNGPLIITFHYGHQSPLCTIQMEALQRYLPKFEAKGASLIAIAASGTKHFYSASSKFPMLQDHSQQQQQDSVASKFGLLYKLPHTGQLLGLENAELPMAATYVMDRTGTILYAHVDADPTKRAEPSHILKAIPTKYQRQAPAKRGPFSLLFGGRLAPRAKRIRRA